MGNQDADKLQKNLKCFPRMCAGMLTVQDTYYEIEDNDEMPSAYQYAFRDPQEWLDALSDETEKAKISFIDIKSQSKKCVKLYGPVTGAGASTSDAFIDLDSDEFRKLPLHFSYPHIAFVLYLFGYNKS